MPGFRLLANLPVQNVADWKTMCDEERIDILRVSATSMPRRDKVLRIAILFAEQFKQPVMDCRLIKKKIRCDCRIVRMSKPSFIDLTGKIYVNDIQVSKCHIEIRKFCIIRLFLQFLLA